MRSRCDERCANPQPAPAGKMIRDDPVGIPVRSRSFQHLVQDVLIRPIASAFFSTVPPDPVIGETSSSSGLSTEPAPNIPRRTRRFSTGSRRSAAISLRVASAAAYALRRFSLNTIFHLDRRRPQAAGRFCRFGQRLPQQVPCHLWNSASLMNRLRFGRRESMRFPYVLASLHDASPRLLSGSRDVSLLASAGRFTSHPNVLFSERVLDAHAVGFLDRPAWKLEHYN